MKWHTRILVGFSAIACAATSQVDAQATKITLYSDTTFTDSTAVDSTAGVLNVYVVVEGIPAATLAMFRIASSPGFTGVWLSDDPKFPLVVGTSKDGIVIAFEACKATPIHILTITYAMDGTSAGGSYVAVVNHPDKTCAMVPDCTAIVPGCGLFSALKGHLLINSATVPIRDTTWGRIKALYRIAQ